MNEDRRAADPAGAPAPGGGGAQIPADRLAALAAYLETNRGRYTDDALRRAAVDAGYDAREIEAAQALSAKPDRGRKASARGIVTVVAYFVGVFVVASILSAIPATSLLALPAVGLGLALSVLAWLMLRDSNPALAEAFRIGVIIVVVLPLALALVALGVCIVAYVGFAR